MDKSKAQWLLFKIEKVLEALVTGPNDITRFIVTFEGKEPRDVDLDRHLSRPN